MKSQSDRPVLTEPVGSPLTQVQLGTVVSLTSGLKLTGDVGQPAYACNAHQGLETAGNSTEFGPSSSSNYAAYRQYWAYSGTARRL